MASTLPFYLSNKKLRKIFLAEGYGMGPRLLLENYWDTALLLIPSLYFVWNNKVGYPEAAD